MKRILGALLPVLVLAGAAEAVIDGRRFESEANKMALDLSNGKPRHLCICQDGSVNNRQIGVLIKSTIGVAGGVRFTMTCQIPTLAANDFSFVVNAENCPYFEVIHR